MPAGPPPTMRQVVLSADGIGRSWHIPYLAPLSPASGRRHHLIATLCIVAGASLSGAASTGGIRVRPVNGFLSWWDGIELWLSGLAFVLQALLIMPVVLMLAYVLAAVLDRVLGKGIELMRRARHADEALG
jgi:hypothetical protein